MSSPDAMTVTFTADEDPWEWDEGVWCTGCLRDRVLSMELVGGRVMGTYELCWQRADYTPEGYIVGWCSSCRAWRAFTR